MEDMPAGKVQKVHAWQSKVKKQDRTTCQNDPLKGQGEGKEQTGRGSRSLMLYSQKFQNPALIVQFSQKVFVVVSQCFFELASDTNLIIIKDNT